MLRHATSTPATSYKAKNGSENKSRMRCIFKWVKAWTTGPADRQADWIMGHEHEQLRTRMGHESYEAWQRATICNKSCHTLSASVLYSASSASFTYVFFLLLFTDLQGKRIEGSGGVGVAGNWPVMVYKQNKELAVPEDKCWGKLSGSTAHRKRLGL